MSAKLQLQIWPFARNSEGRENFWAGGGVLRGGARPKGRFQKALPKGAGSDAYSASFTKNVFVQQTRQS